MRMYKGNLLKYIATVILGKNLRKEEIHENGDVVILTPKHIISSESIKLDGTEKRVNSEDIEPKYIIQKGDVIMVNSYFKEEEVGNFCVFDLEIKAIPSSHLTIIRSNEIKLPEMLKKEHIRIKALAKGQKNKRISTDDLVTFQFLEEVWNDLN